MSTEGRSYYVILFGKDGNKSIATVLDSLLAQTVPPSKIMAVDDGSRDGMYENLLEYQYRYPDLIDVQETGSTTRDFRRLPMLWNMGLQQGYDFHMIVPSDASFVPNYAETLLSELANDERLVICSGDWGSMRSQSPHGGGRFVRQTFFDRHYPNGYPQILGYESEILERALTNGYRIKIRNDLEIFHHDRLGHSHDFREFGYGMKCLGYYKPYVFARILYDFFYNDQVGKKGALKMLYYYLTFTPEQTGYYSQYLPEIRAAVAKRQKAMLRSAWKIPAAKVYRAVKKK